VFRANHMRAWRCLFPCVSCFRPVDVASGSFSTATLMGSQTDHKGMGILRMLTGAGVPTATEVMMEVATFIMSGLGTCRHTCQAKHARVLRGDRPAPAEPGRSARPHRRSPQPRRPRDRDPGGQCPGCVRAGGRGLSLPRRTRIAILRPQRGRRLIG
jgi:hypothetical protein